MNIFVIVFTVISITYKIANATDTTCCPKGVLLSEQNKHCEDGSQMKQLPCALKFIIRAKETNNFTINDQNELVLMYNSLNKISEPIETNRYCLATLSDKTDVAIVCGEEYSETQYYLVRIVCQLISTVFFTVTFFVYLSTPQLRDLQGKCVLSITSSLAVGYLILSLIQIKPEVENPFCEWVAYSLYLFFMSAFFWMNALSLSIWKAARALTFCQSDSKCFLWLSSYGYGIPALLLIVLIVFQNITGNLTPNFGLNSCWFFDNTTTWVYFYSPVTVTVAINVVFFIWTFFMMCKQSGKTSNKCTVAAFRYKCSVYFNLCILMGLPWIFEILSFIFKDKSQHLDIIWSIFDYFNMLQGVWMFIVLVVKRSRAVNVILENKCFGSNKKRKDPEDDYSEVTQTLSVPA